MRLTINGGGSVFLTGLAVSRVQDVRLNTPTTTRDASGRETSDAEGGTMVSTVAELAHIPARLVRRMEIQRVGAPGAVVLTGREVRGGFAGDPSGETRYATIRINYGHRVRFFRPLRGAGDVNAPDSVNSARDDDLNVQLTTTNDAVRDVRARSGDATPRPGKPTSFSAHVDHPPAGVGFTYSWDFGDGTSGAGQTPAHAYPAGHYIVTVTAVGSDGSAGVAAPVEIQVDKARKPAPGSPPTSKPPGSSPGSGGPGAGGGAPNGGGVGDAGQRASGPASSRGQGERTQRAHGRASPTATPASAPPPRPEASTRARARKPAPAPVTTGTPVEGVLLAGAGSPAEVDRVLRSVPPPVAQERSPVRRGGGSNASPAGWLGGSGLIVLLLAAGALREGGVRRRGLRRW